MGSTPFDLHRRAPEQKKGKGLKLPKIGLPKIGLKKLIVGGAALAALGLYTFGNTYSVGPNEAVYSFNSIRSAENRVRVYQGSGIDLPFIEHNLHLPWPLGGGDAPGGWPIGAHAVVPLAGTFRGTVKTPMYNSFIEDLTYSVDDNDVDAFVLEFGRYAMATTALERVAEGDDFSLTGMIEAVREDGGEVDAATEALINRIDDVISFVQRGKSVEEINSMKDDPVFMAYLINEIEEMIPTIHIETLRLGDVTRNKDVITVTTADGCLVDVQVLYGSTSAGWSTSTSVDAEVVQQVFAEHYLMELRSGELPEYINQELADALGVDEQSLTTLGQYERLARANAEAQTQGASVPRTTRRLVVNLGNAQDQFYRKSFDSGMLAFGMGVAQERMAMGDLEGSVEMLLGIVEHAYMHPLSPQAQVYVSDAMLDLGWLYEGLAQTAYIEGDYEASAGHARNAAKYFLDFLNTAPAGHPELDDIADHLHSKYGELFDWSGLRMRDGAEVDLDKYTPEGTSPAPTEEAPAEETPEATPEATPES